MINCTKNSNTPEHKDRSFHRNVDLEKIQQELLKMHNINVCHSYALHFLD